MAQINPVVGDFAGNTEIIRRAIGKAAAAGAGLVAFPELALTGYPPEDLLFKRSFVEDNVEALHELARSAEIPAVIGYVEPEGDLLYNAAAVVSGGRVLGTYRKHHLPNYGVFDERRYFHPGEGVLILNAGGVPIGVTICEDLWDEGGPHAVCRAAGARWILNINASPYHRGKGKERLELIGRRARELGIGFLYVNMVGGQDELVFDGQSVVVGADGHLISRGLQFRGDLLLADVSEAAPVETAVHLPEPVVQVEVPVSPVSGSPAVSRIATELGEVAEVYEALVLGVRDYLGKNGFTRALVGISGGIDSALTATIAVDALGRRNVLGVCNPGPYTSQRTIDYSRMLAGNLGIKLELIPIGEPYEAMRSALEPVLQDGDVQLAEENLQARIRGTLWMAISNQSGRIVLSTGNKSELAVGYATLYGDMAGGFAVLKDVPKTLVYNLAIWRNTAQRLIPVEILDRPPTAELRPGQLDTDSLPPYHVLDPILEAYISDDLPPEKIADLGFDRATVDRVVAMVDRAEYKRRQAAPGIKVTDRAFGRDRRLPITNQYRHGGP